MPSFRQIGDEVFTCVSPPGFEKDPGVTRAIQEFDPGAIPFWRLQRWEIDGKLVRIVHHGIGRYYPFPRHLRRHFHVEMPADADFPAPNFLDAVFEDQENIQYYRGGPGGYIPWDWATYRWCRAKFEIITKDAFEKRVQRHRERIEKERAAWQEEIAYRKKQIEPYLLRQLDRISDSDWAQLRARQHRNEVRRKLGLPTESHKQPKPFVQVQSPSAPTVSFGAVIRSPRIGETYGRVAPAQGEPS